MDHYTDYNSFGGALVGFTRQAREYGFVRGLQCTQDTVHAALSGIWWDTQLFEYALTSLYCKEEQQKEKFSTLFKRFWSQRGTRLSQKSDYFNKKTVKKNSQSIAVMTGVGKVDKDGVSEQGKTTTGANAKETLKSTDFSKIKIDQLDDLDEIADQLVKEMSLRIKRKRKKAKSGIIDIRRSIRDSLQYGGNVMNLSHTTKKKEKLRLLILLDVSGSMDKYSYFLLKFLWSLNSHFKQIEAFSFSTKMMRITDWIEDPDIAIALSKVSENATNWSSGTKIGECLKQFNEQFSKRYLNGKTLTIVMSDGLDTGEQEILESEIIDIKRRSKKLVWLNPLKGTKGYEPVQQGIKTVMPSLDFFQSAHNFNSLLKLENILVNA